MFELRGFCASTWAACAGVTEESAVAILSVESSCRWFADGDPR